MKCKILIVFLVLIVLFSFQSCKVSKNNVSQSNEYNSLKINDNGEIAKGSNYVSYSLQDFVLLLEEKGITITEIKGSDKAFISDGGSVIYENTLWNYTFYPKINYPYDIDSLKDLINQQTIEAVYVKTPCETFIFRQSFEKPGMILPIGAFYLDVVITINPSFITEKGVKIGDSFEYASKKYNFNTKDIIKISDYEWSIWIPDSNIIFNGGKDKIRSITLGYQSACIF